MSGNSDAWDRPMRPVAELARGWPAGDAGALGRAPPAPPHPPGEPGSAAPGGEVEPCWPGADGWPEPSGGVAAGPGGGASPPELVPPGFAPPAAAPLGGDWLTAPPAAPAPPTEFAAP